MKCQAVFYAVIPYENGKNTICSVKYSFQSVEKPNRKFKRKEWFSMHSQFLLLLDSSCSFGNFQWKNSIVGVQMEWSRWYFAYLSFLFSTLTFYTKNGWNVGKKERRTLKRISISAVVIFVLLLFRFTVRSNQRKNESFFYSSHVNLRSKVFFYS